MTAPFEGTWSDHFSHFVSRHTNCAQKETFQAPSDLNSYIFSETVPEDSSHPCYVRYETACIFALVKNAGVVLQTSRPQDNPIHSINLYLVDCAIDFHNTYPANSDLPYLFDQATPGARVETKCETQREKNYPSPYTRVG